MDTNLAGRLSPCCLAACFVGWLIGVGQAVADEQPPFHIQAHRGAGIARPENTLESFRATWQLQVTPEADLRTTSDGHIVCFHDADLKRVVRDLPGPQQNTDVGRMSLAELQKVDVGSFRGRQFAGQRIPTIESVFAEMRGHPQRLLYLDIKTADLAQLARLIAEFDVARQVIFTTSEHRLIQDWKRRVPQSQTLLWNGGSEQDLAKKLDSVRKAKFDGITHLQIHVRVGDLQSDEPFIPSSRFLQSVGEELESRGIVFQVLPWECSDQRAYERLLDLGVDSFATDYPEVTLSAVKSFRRLKRRSNTNE
jgi:glycerophosphoryl diester phosphodiesterase